MMLSTYKYNGIQTWPPSGPMETKQKKQPSERTPLMHPVSNTSPWVENLSRLDWASLIKVA
jgi:hypothetical protein